MMWGDRSPRAKLTGDSRRGFEAVLIGDSRSFRSLARNWPLRLLRLLQQYLPLTEVALLDDLRPRASARACARRLQGGGPPQQIIDQGLGRPLKPGQSSLDVAALVVSP